MKLEEIENELAEINARMRDANRAIAGLVYQAKLTFTTNGVHTPADTKRFYACMKKRFPDMSRAEVTKLAELGEMLQ